MTHSPFPKLSTENLKRASREDRSLVGITFVDVLFALVIGKTLEVAVLWRELPAAGLFHLSVVFTLVVTSWIGYHNSWNRPRYFIGFSNWPAAQFGLDVMLVIVYWFAASHVDGAPGSLSPEPSAIPEANLVALSALLYLAWDGVAHRIRKSPKYPRLPYQFDAPERRKVTNLFFIAALLLMLYVTFLNTPRTNAAVAVVDVLLIFLLLGYRFLKELAVSPREVEPRTSEDLHEAARLIARATSSLSGEEGDDQ